MLDGFWKGENGMKDLSFHTETIQFFFLFYSFQICFMSIPFKIIIHLIYFIRIKNKAKYFYRESLEQMPSIEIIFICHSFLLCRFSSLLIWYCLHVFGCTFNAMIFCIKYDVKGLRSDKTSLFLSVVFVYFLLLLYA